MTKILAFSGSGRLDSFNQKLVCIAARGAQALGSQVTIINLTDFPMPLFSQDIEQQSGMPENAAKFKELIMQHDGLLIASAEHNGAYSALLKNALDWASRATSPDEVPLSAFQGKFATIMSTSRGSLGGLTGLIALRTLLNRMGVLVMPEQITIGNAYSAFANNKLVDPVNHERVRILGENLHRFITKIAP